MEYLKVLKISDGTELIFRPSGLRGSETDTSPPLNTHKILPRGGSIFLDLKKLKIFFALAGVLYFYQNN